MSFIINPESIVDFKSYKCDKKTADYLIYEKHLPLFSLDRETHSKKPYIFAITDELLSALDEYSKFNNHGA